MQQRRDVVTTIIVAVLLAGATVFGITFFGLF